MPDFGFGLGDVPEASAPSPVAPPPAAEVQPFDGFPEMPQEVTMPVPIPSRVQVLICGGGHVHLILTEEGLAPMPINLDFGFSGIQAETIGRALTSGAEALRGEDSE
jgi:hypothetical protein